MEWLLVLTKVRHSICPSLRVGLGALDRADVVRLAVVVPVENLHDVDLIAVRNQGLPSRIVGPIVSEIDPLRKRSARVLVAMKPLKSSHSCCTSEVSNE